MRLGICSRTVSNDKGGNRNQRTRSSVARSTGPDYAPYVHPNSRTASRESRIATVAYAPTSFN